MKEMCFSRFLKMAKDLTCVWEWFRKPCKLLWVEQAVTLHKYSAINCPMISFKVQIPFLTPLDMFDKLLLT